MSTSSLISVVEDDRFFRESMQRLMRSLGYAVEAFSSAADFLASPRVDETSCLIADVHMPAMSGIELYRHLIAAGRTIPTILVTAYPSESERVCALTDGVIGYLHKPVDERHLLRCLAVKFLGDLPLGNLSGLAVVVVLIAVIDAGGDARDHPIQRPGEPGGYAGQFRVLSDADARREAFHPVAVGRGKPSLPDELRAKLELLDERRFDNGVVYVGYRIQI